LFDGSYKQFVYIVIIKIIMPGRKKKLL